MLFYFYGRATTVIYTFPYTTLFRSVLMPTLGSILRQHRMASPFAADDGPVFASEVGTRSEEHTSELQSHSELVCRLLLEKKKHYRNKRTRDEKTETRPIACNGYPSP